MLIHHHSLCSPHVSGTLFTLGFNLLLVADSSVPLLPQEAHPCSSCLYSSQWEREHKEQEFWPLTLAYGLLPTFSFQNFLFCLSSTGASSSVLSIQHFLYRGRNGDPSEIASETILGWLWWEFACSFFHLPSNMFSSCYKCQCSLFCFILFCLNTLQSASSLVPTGYWNAPFYDLKLGFCMNALILSNW